MEPEFQSPSAPWPSGGLGDLTERIARIGSWRWDVVKDQVFWSPGLYEVFGMDPAESAPALSGLQQRFVSESWNLLKKRVAHCLYSGDPYTLDLTAIRQNGEHFASRCWGQVTRMESGKVTQLGGAFQEVSDLKQAQSDYDRERRRLGFVIQGSNMGTWEWNLQTDETVFNETWAEMVGYSLAELEPTTIDTWKELTHPDDLERAGKTIQEYLAGKHPAYEVEIRMRHKDGRWIWILDRGMALEWDEDGRLLKMFGTHTNITRLKEESLRAKERERFLNSILQTTPDGFWIVDSQGTIMEANEAYCRMSGYSRDELIGKPIHELDVNESPEDTRMRTQSIQKRGMRFQSEHLRKDGSIMQVEVSANYIGEEDGRFIGFIRDNSQRIAYEAALEKSEETLRSTLEDLLVGVVVHGLDSKILMVNPKASELLGLTHDQFMGRDAMDPVWHFIDENEQRLSLDQYPAMQVLRSRKSLENRIMGVVIQGRIDPGWLSVSAVPVWDSTGEMVRIVVNFIDISDLFRMERALQQSEERFALAIEGTRDGLWDWNLVTDEAYFSDRWAEMLGYQPDDLPRSSAAWLDLLHPEDRDAAIREVEVYLKSGGDGVYESTYRLRTRSGDYRWISGRGKAVFDEKGKALRLLGFDTDITDRLEAEQRFRSLFEASPIGIAHCRLVYDEAGQAADYFFIDTNSNYEKFTGINPKGKLASQAFKIAPEALRERAARLAEVVHDRKTLNFEQQIPSSGRIYSVIAYPMEPGHFGVAFLEITEQRSLEEQLAQAQKMESIGRLAGGVAHDFNNKLNIILGHAELMLNDLPEGHPLESNITEIRQAAHHSAELTRQLLAFARKQTVAPKVLDLNTTLESMLKMLRRVIGEDITLSWKPASCLFSVRLDPVQLDQLLVNLLVNARDAIPSNGRIQIRTFNRQVDPHTRSPFPQEMEPGSYVCLQVEDNGCGMDEAVRSKVFEPFFTTKGIGKGTGLGLSTVYGIVKQNGGWIQLESEPGRGTTFSMYFPSVSSPTKPRENREQQRFDKDEHGGRETILVVEDEEAVLKISKMILERLGYTVYTASSPTHAIELSRELGSGLDLLMTDVIMPAMNGRDLAREIRNIQPGLRVLFMSGYTASHFVSDELGVEGRFFIQKPFTAKELGAKVREALEDVR